MQRPNKIHSLPATQRQFICAPHMRAPNQCARSPGTGNLRTDDDDITACANNNLTHNN